MQTDPSPKRWETQNVFTAFIECPLYIGIIRNGELVREVRARYQCHYNVRHPGECDGQSRYGVKKLDGIVDQIVRYQFSRISAASGAEIVARQNEKAIELAKARYNVSFEDFRTMAAECEKQGKNKQPLVYVTA